MGSFTVACNIYDSFIRFKTPRRTDEGDYKTGEIHKHGSERGVCLIRRFFNQRTQSESFNLAVGVMMNHALASGEKNMSLT